jgi:hypothetical protein
VSGIFLVVLFVLFTELGSRSRDHVFVDGFFLRFSLLRLFVGLFLLLRWVVLLWCCGLVRAVR